MKKTIDFCEKGLFKSISRFYKLFRCFDDRQNKLRVYTKDESTYICRFYVLMYSHR